MPSRHAGLGVAVLLSTAVSAHAHTLASTIVSVVADDKGIVSITIAAEADPLIAKLELLAGRVTSDPPMTAADRRRRLESLFPTLRTNIDARINDITLPLKLHEVSVDDTAQVEVRLTAPMPDGRRIFTWRSAFVFGAYQFAVTSGGEPEVVQWLQGRESSTPRVLEPPVAAADAAALGLTRYRIGCSLAMSAVAVFVFFRHRHAQRLAGG
jgi:hypothetical protein